MKRSSRTNSAVLAAALVSLLIPWSELAAQRSREEARVSRSTSGSSVRATRNVNRTRSVDRTRNVNQNVDVNRNVNVRNRPAYRVNHGGEVDVYRGPRGTVAIGEEGAAAVGWRGAAVVTEEGAAAVGRYGGAVAVGEEGYARRYRAGSPVYYGHHEYYEDHEGWKVAAGVVAGIAIGTMIATPPPATTLPVGCTTIMHAGVVHHSCSGVYYRPAAGGFRVVVF